MGYLQPVLGSDLLDEIYIPKRAFLGDNLSTGRTVHITKYMADRSTSHFRPSWTSSSQTFHTAHEAKYAARLAVSTLLTTFTWLFDRSGRPRRWVAEVGCYER